MGGIIQTRNALDKKCTQIPPGTVLNNIVHVLRCSYVPIFTFVRWALYTIKFRYQFGCLWIKARVPEGVRIFHSAIKHDIDPPWYFWLFPTFCDNEVKFSYAVCQVQKEHQPNAILFCDKTRYRPDLVLLIVCNILR